MKNRNDPCPCGSGKKYKHCCLPGASPSSGEPRAMPLSGIDAVEHSRLGSVLLESGREQEALASFRLALEVDPRFAYAHNGMGIALKNLGRLDEAAAAYRAAIRVESRHAPAHHNLGEVLYRQGQIDGARVCFESALAIEPHLWQAHLSLGNALADLGELEAAISRYRAVIAANSNLWAAYLGLGTALSLAGQAEESLRCFRKAAELQPNSAETLFNLARAQLQEGNTQDAVDSLQKALDIKPVFPEAAGLLAAAFCCEGRFDEAIARWPTASSNAGNPRGIYFALGDTLIKLGLNAGARSCFEQFLRIDPDNPAVKHLLAALQGITPEHPADAYVEDVFDAYAAAFDEHLQKTLRYAVPRLLADSALQLATRSTPWDVLDLGCGTGLFGEAIADSARSLAGVDLSGKMLEQARARRKYSRLERANLAAALAREAAEGYDLVAAADVFIYVGKLDEIVSQIRALLRPAGLFAFSIETADDEPAGATGDRAGYRLMTTGRYVHELAYLSRLANSNRFTVKLKKKVRLRLEGSRPVPGWLVVWEAS